MKRRLSVAISLVGRPAVVYLDEPSTGLDPASRRDLWRTVERAKEHAAVLLTTHSMEEAEYLCDRLGIFVCFCCFNLFFILTSTQVDGRMICLGSPKDLVKRFGGYYIVTFVSHPSKVRRVWSVVGVL